MQHINHIPTGNALGSTRFRLGQRTRVASVVLAFPYNEHTFIFDTGASGTALGAVLYQYQIQNRVARHTC